MEALVNELASLRIAIATSIASDEQRERASFLTSSLPESAVEDAEARVESILPSVLSKPYLKIEVLIDGKAFAATGQIIKNLVLCGGCWYPGVVVCGLDDDLVTDTIAYAINDGGVLADHIEPAEEGESVIRWRVSHVSSDVLKLLRRLNAKLPAGSVLTTEDGMRFTVSAEGLITDGDLSYTSMSELGVSFVLEAHHGSI